MRGLLIKDFYCLKKNLINYVFVIAGVIGVSVSFVLSFNFGNIHKELAKQIESGLSTQSEITQIATISILLFMIIPFVATGDAAINLISDDEKAGFYKVVSALPVTIEKRVMCRFVTGYIFIAIGAVVDFLMVIVISRLTDIISFGNFCGVIVTAASVMMIFDSLFILFVYISGKRNLIYLEIMTLLIEFAAYIAANFERILAFLKGEESAIKDIYNRTMDFIFNKSYILLISALIIFATSYFMTVNISKRKRGMV